MGGTLFFAAFESASGLELWKSNGTPDGTVLAADIRPGSSGSTVAQLFNVAGRLFFAAAAVSNNRELWALDTGIVVEGEDPEGEGAVDGEGAIEGVIEGAGEGTSDGEGSAEGEGAIEGAVEGGTEGEGGTDGEGTVEGEGSMDGEGVTEGEGAADGEGTFDGEIYLLDLPEIATRILQQYPVLDTNGDGVINRQELAEYLLSILADILNSQKGDPNLEELVEEAFDLLDKNGDELLSVGELRDEAGADAPVHAIDQDADGVVSLAELLRAIQLYNAGLYSCAENAGATEDGYKPGPGGTDCVSHASDYEPADFIISLSELLRAIQFYNSGGLAYCPDDLESEDGFCAGIVG